jgi:hypothetical protein
MFLPPQNGQGLSRSIVFLLSNVFFPTQAALANAHLGYLGAFSLINVGTRADKLRRIVQYPICRFIEQRSFASAMRPP